MDGLSTIGVVLAGGASRRMGVDKLSLPATPEGKTTILEHVVMCTACVTDAIYVAHAPEPSFSQAQLTSSADSKNLNFIHDEEWYHGPLGVLGRLSLSLPKADYVVIAAGDLPGLHQEVLAACLDRLKASDDADAALVEREHVLQPLLGCYRHSALSTFFDAWQQGEKRLMRVMESFKIDCVVAEQAVWPTWWTRPVHTPEDYAVWKSEWRRYHAT